MARSRARAAIKSYISSKENRILNSKSTKSFYAYVKKNISSSHNYPHLLKQDGTFSSDPMEMANIFKKELSHNYTSQTYELPQFDPLTDNSCSDPKFSYIFIVKIISELKPSAAGINGKPVIFLKKTACYNARPLVILFLQCFFMGKIPNMWRQSIVVPIFKKGAKNNPSCYRPVSLTCTACKVIEKIISDTIMKHLISNKLLSKCQYGFVPHSSVNECLL